jgi:hypothetical protein
MNKLLVFTAVAEGVTGIVLFAYPPVVVWLLFGEGVADAGLIMGRLAGLCLIALAVACWPDGESVRGFYGMLAWSALAALYLIVVGVGGTAGILLWPMVVVHVVLAILLIRARSKEQKMPAA